MHFLYNTGIHLYSWAIRLASPFHAKARLFRAGRRRLFKRLQAAITDEAPVVWFHCASLGEFEQGRPLMEAYRQQCPEHKLLLTFFSPSGYELRKDYPGADWVFYLPLDTPRNARRLIGIVKPRMAIFIKYDFWYNILQALQAQGVPTYVVSAIFRPAQLFFKSYGGFFRNMLHAYRQLFVQDNYSQELLQSIGITRVQVSGDTRFDRVRKLAQASRTIPPVEPFLAGQPALIAGSTWPADEDKLAGALAALPAPVKLIIAPHEIHEERLAAIERRFRKGGTVRYSALCDGSQPAAPHCRTLIVDTIGLLAALYRYGKAAYIGGGFSISGIHNTLEAAVYGLPVVFGPNYQRFREACDLITQGGAVGYTNEKKLEAILLRWFTDDDARRAAGEINRQYVIHHCGATAMILQALVEG
ncbi:MAG: 3-deoxy-D-manno-octulosonic acid transferase [Prevotellaceae bacterium]|jgi:3-deoxy-D-manno-octulosonic-acid transferase|nr:3-deoxy-D-manno-octulosonic acid transferase [Prevotellaceae bacterium]